MPADSSDTFPAATRDGANRGRNPLGTDGFEFVEFSAPDAAGLRHLHKLFQTFGFRAAARHKRKKVTLYRQGDINLLVNEEEKGFFRDFSRQHGPCASAMAFRVQDAEHALQHAVSCGARPLDQKNLAPGELDIPAVFGIGGSLLYFVDRYGDQTIYDNDFDYLPGGREAHGGTGLQYIDHLTHNVYRGNMDKWAGFYEKIGNFKQVRYFDIEGKLTGLFSRAMTSPCGKIRIPINESADDHSQIEEYLRDYKGEGIQHIALYSSDIHRSVRALRHNGIQFMSTPDTYFDRVDARVPGHGEDLDALRAEHILIDGAPEAGQGILLQIFTSTVIGPIFFEIIQRKGNEGFGEGNFQALFDSIEEDQIRRGVLAPATGSAPGRASAAREHGSEDLESD